VKIACLGAIAVHTAASLGAFLKYLKNL